MYRLLLVVGLLTLGASAQAQRPRGDDARDRVALEARFRQRLRTVMQQRLGLTDAQVDRLAQVNTKYETRRRAVYMSEREVRMGLRRELAPDSGANNDRVAELMDRALKLQRDRLDLLEAEQRELQQFMSPVQRAKYFGMQEQLRRQMDEMRDRRGGDSARGQQHREKESRRKPPGDSRQR